MNKLFFASMMLCSYIAFGQLTEFKCDDNTHGYKDASGKIVIPCLRYNMFRFGDDEIVLRYNDKIYIYDKKTGKEISIGKYDDIKWDFDNYKEGFACVNIGSVRKPYSFKYSGGKWGYIDRSGKEICPLKYDSVQFFSQGLGAVSLGNKHGYINAEGKEIIPLKFDSVSSFEKGRAKVVLNGKEIYINSSGKEIIPQTVNFVKLSYSKALEQSKKTNKPIFLYCPSGGCGAQTNLINKTILNQNIAEYLNENFICVEIEYEDVSSKIQDKIIDLITLDGKEVRWLAASLLFIKSNEEAEKIKLNFGDYTENNKAVFNIGKDFVKK